jgi:glutaredoxin
MEEVIVYSTGCPQCEALEQMLNSHQIKYTVCSDREKMLSMGLTHVPVLEANGTLMNFKEAITWIGARA